MDENRFVRQTCLQDVGDVGQEKLSRGKVLVIGAGGTGSAVILYLAGAGLHTLNICESDVVEESNLHRQVLYTDKHVGARKAPIASCRVSDSGFTNSTYSIHPFQRVREKSIYSTGHLTHALQYDVVLDCTDRWSAHDDVVGYYVPKKIPVVQGTIQGLIGRVTTFHPGDPCWRCLHPEKPTVTREGPRGTLGPVCGVIGSLMAMEALRILLEAPSRGPEMLVYSARQWQFETMLRSFDPACSCRDAQSTAASAASESPARGSPRRRKRTPKARKDSPARPR